MWSFEDVKYVQKSEFQRQKDGSKSQQTHLFRFTLCHYFKLSNSFIITFYVEQWQQSCESGLYTNKTISDNKTIAFTDNF